MVVSEINLFFLFCGSWIYSLNIVYFIEFQKLEFFHSSTNFLFFRLILLQYHLLFLFSLFLLSLFLTLFFLVPPWFQVLFPFMYSVDLYSALFTPVFLPFLYRFVPDIPKFLHVFVLHKTIFLNESNRLDCLVLYLGLESVLEIALTA